MMSFEGCAKRRERLWESLPESCDALVITTPESLIYFAGYAPSPFVFNTVESTAALVLWPDRAVLIGDNLLRPFLDESRVDEVVALEWYTGKKSAPSRRDALLDEVCLRRLPDSTGARIGVEHRWPGIPANSGAQILGPLIRALRRAKDEEELTILRESVRAGEAAHAAALAEIKPGMTELDAYSLVSAEAVRALGGQVLLYGDFVSGPRCEIERGGPPSRRVIERGDLMLLDFSVVVHGYRADFANTFVVGADPTPRRNELYELCMGALEAGESMLRPGVEGSRVDAAVRGHFARYGMAEFFPSHSGHGLGLGHPEPPYLVPESTDVLRAGDVVALEPGLYISSVGGMRFERNYLITADGHEILSRHRLGLTP